MSRFSPNRNPQERGYRYVRFTTGVPTVGDFSLRDRDQLGEDPICVDSTSGMFYSLIKGQVTPIPSQAAINTLVGAHPSTLSTQQVEGPRGWPGAQGPIGPQGPAGPILPRPNDGERGPRGAPAQTASMMWMLPFAAAHG